MYTVADLMTRELVTLKENDDLGLAEAIMSFGKVRHLPVVREGRLVGLVTHRDLLRALAVRAESAGVTPAGEVMTREVVTVHPATSLRRALRTMLHNKFGCLPVVEDGKLVGIITEADLVRFAANIVGELDRIEQLGSEVHE